MRENSTPEQLQALAADILNEAPCSLEMPAGTGKTHLLATAVAKAANQGERSLILTHTNAGVDALRKRLARFGVSSKLYRIDTITGFAFSLVRSYSSIAGITVPTSPDWSDSNDYLAGAKDVAEASAIKSVLRLSFAYFFVDEYQDCNQKHHDFILKIAESVPKTVVLGDRLQGIFGFNEPLVDWDNDVLPAFPMIEVAYTPHRWKDNNIELGNWLQQSRQLMVAGQTIDLGSISIPGFEWIQASNSSLRDRALSFMTSTDTVILIDKWPNDVARHASMLGGSYVVIEDIQGKFMIDELNKLPQDGDPKIAWWLAEFAKKCMVGLSGVDAPVLAKLHNNASITHYNRAGIEDILNALDNLRQNPQYKLLLMTAKVIADHSSTKVYRWEAWKDTLSSIAKSLDTGNDPLSELGLIRDKVRHTGRRPYAKIASRTLLVKGLEFDHVIIANCANLLDAKNLYVALTRARKSITIFSNNSQITLRDE